MIIYFRIIDATIRGAQKIMPDIAGNRWFSNEKYHALATPIKPFVHCVIAITRYFKKSYWRCSGIQPNVGQIANREFGWWSCYDVNILFWCRPTKAFRINPSRDIKRAYAAPTGSQGNPRKSPVPRLSAAFHYMRTSCPMRVRFASKFGSSNAKSFPSQVAGCLHCLGRHGICLCHPCKQRQ